MAFSAVAFIAPNYRDFKNYWLKAYNPGTTTPKVMALDNNGTVQVEKLQLNANGFIVSAGQALVVPYIDGPYDLWLFPTPTEADANNTSSAKRVADNIEPIGSTIINDLSQDYIFDTVAAYQASTIVFPIGKTIHLNDRDADFAVVAGTATGSKIIASTSVSQSIVLDVSGYVTARNFGAYAGVASPQHAALNAAIEESAGKFKLHITADKDGNKDYQVNSTVFMDWNDLNIEFTGGCYLRPFDSLIQQPLIIGGIRNNSGPTNLYIVNPSVQRPSLNLVNSTRGIIFKEMNQSTIVNPESRYSTFNLQFFPTAGACAYNTIINPQGIGGVRNFYLEAQGTGYCNENTFVGGRGFGTANMVTNLYISGGGAGTGHNKFLGLSVESLYGDQAIWDNGTANQFLQCRTENVNGWNSPNTAGHVFGIDCLYPMIQSSRYDYKIDQSAAADPRAQIIAYQGGSHFNTAVNGETTINAGNQSAVAGSILDGTSTLDGTTSFLFRAIRKAGALVRASLSTNGTYFGRSYQTESSGYNFDPILLGSTRIWVDGSFIRTRQSITPTSATDGAILTQNQTSVAAGLGNIANSVNTFAKYTGKEVFDTTTGRPVWATGSGASAVWVFSDGTTAYTPT
jgi:hypothetical protein